jgi:hypothetical protein
MAKRKSLDLIVLLLISVLVVTASAAIYYSLSLEPEVMVSTPAIRFESGTDTPGSSNVTDAWCLLRLKSYPNATLTYDDALNISNTDTNNEHSFKLKHSSVTPDNGTVTVGNWSYIKFIIYDENGTQKASLNYTVSGNNWTLAPASGETSQLTIPADKDWTVKAITLSPATATEGQVCKIKISVDVNE